jgi:hypothetical protein
MRWLGGSSICWSCGDCFFFCAFVACWCINGPHLPIHLMGIGLVRVQGFLPIPLPADTSRLNPCGYGNLCTTGQYEDRIKPGTEDYVMMGRGGYWICWDNLILECHAEATCYVWWPGLIDSQKTDSGFEVNPMPTFQFGSSDLVWMALLGSAIPLNLNLYIGLV